MPNEDKFELLTSSRSLPFKPGKENRANGLKLKISGIYFFNKDLMHPEYLQIFIFILLIRK